jgi:hypothetical protein
VLPWEKIIIVFEGQLNWPLTVRSSLNRSTISART